MSELLPLRPNVCLIIRNRDNRLFLGERVEPLGHWQLPQGGIKSRQTIEEAAIEEAHEELGASRELFGLRGILLYAHSYEWDRVPQHYRGIYRGQHQRFAIIDFLGKDEDIKVDWCVNRKNETAVLELDDDYGQQCDEKDDFIQEFCRWKWCTIGEVMDNCAPLRRKGYRGAFIEYLEKFG